MFAWLVRLPFVVAVAFLMGWLGYSLMCLGWQEVPGLDDPFMRQVIGASIVLWTVISFVLVGRKLETWVAAGVLSPVLGGALIHPLAFFIPHIMLGYVVFPVGIATGLLMGGIFEIGKLRPPTLPAAPVDGSA
ncbi:MAG: hypothetical protein ACRDD1_22130 [Planctomycetia bacterium]